MMRLLSGRVFALMPHSFNGFFGKIPQFAHNCEDNLAADTNPLRVLND